LSDQIVGLLISFKQFVDQVLVQCHRSSILEKPALTQNFLHPRVKKSLLPQLTNEHRTLKSEHFPRFPVVQKCPLLVSSSRISEDFLMYLPIGDPIVQNLHGRIPYVAKSCSLFAGCRSYDSGIHDSRSSTGPTGSSSGSRTDSVRGSAR